MVIFNSRNVNLLNFSTKKCKFYEINELKHILNLGVSSFFEWCDPRIQQADLTTSSVRNTNSWLNSGEADFYLFWYRERERSGAFYQAMLYVGS